jgi:PAS domain S-box-containing protein
MEPERRSGILENSVESIPNRSLEAELKRVTWELASHKIELHKTTGYLQCILQNATDLIFATDAEGLLVSFSRGGENVLGYAWDEIAGRPIRALAQDPEAFEPVMRSCQEEGCALAMDVPFRHKDGKTVYVNSSLMNLTNREGKRVGTVGVCQDITRWKRLQADLIQVDRLAEIGRIAAGVAHEINNPLAVISESSGLARDLAGYVKGLRPDDRQELMEALDKVRIQVGRCRDITHKLLGFARDSASTKTAFDLHKLLEETVDFLRAELKDSPVEISLAFAAGPVSVNSNPKLLGQVFVNLIVNAMHAVEEKGEDNGRITIDTLKKDSEIEISVEDNGTGIPEQDQEKVFDLFYTTKPPGKGTGLGLPICRNIIRQLGGEILLESVAGVGTTLTVRIPVP